MKATARLHAHLLARKGEALPAIKRQRLALAESGLSGHEGLETEDMANMMVSDMDQKPAVFGRADPARRMPPSFGTNQPSSLKEADSASSAPAQVSFPRETHQKVTRPKRIALTLRLDKERHFRLKLLSAHKNLSGQELMIEALDALLEQHRTIITDCPCLRAPHNPGTTRDGLDCPNGNDSCQAKS